MRVVEALSFFPGQESAYLRSALSDPDELVRVQAAETIGARAERSLRDELRVALRDKSALVRSYAAAAMGSVGGPADTALLRERLSREKSDTARVGFVEALWLLGDRLALQEALNLLKSGDYRVRCAISRTLANTFLAKKTRPAIESALRSTLRKERSLAAREAIQGALEVVEGRKRSDKGMTTMVNLPRYRSVTDPIADDRWSYVSADGRSKTSQIIIGRPRPWPGDENGDWVCPIFIEHDTPGVQAIAGVGPVDSLMNAVAAVQAFADEIGRFAPRTQVPPIAPRAPAKRKAQKSRGRRRL